MIQIKRKHRIGADSKIASHKQRIRRFRGLSKTAADTSGKSKLFHKKPPLKSTISAGVGPSSATRTHGLLVPNCCPNFFPLVYSHFRSFPLGFPYSLTLFEALFPRVPRLTVVIYVVKNHCGARGSSARKTK